MAEPGKDGIQPNQIVEIIRTLSPEQRKLFEIFGGDDRSRRQRKVEDTDSRCPYCGEGDIHYDNDLREDFNITIQDCRDCGMEWCKEQSMKIPAVLIRQIALALRDDQSYTGVSEFVRASIRLKCAEVSNSAPVAANRNMETLVQLMALSAEYDEEYEDEE